MNVHGFGHRVSLFRLVFLLFFLFVVVPALMGAAPHPQASPPPDPGNFALYGVPWALVGLILVGLAKKYFTLSDEGGVLMAAVWAVIGYLVIQNLPDLEAVAPWLPKYIPQALWAVLIFGSQLGLQPGATARKVVALFRP